MYNSSQIGAKGYIQSNASPGVDSFKGELYLIKWTDLPYQECTWELYEDLVAHPSIGKDVVKELRKNYKNAGKSIRQLLTQPDYCKFGSRRPYVEFTASHPDFLVDVNKKF